MTVSLEASSAGRCEGGLTFPGVPTWGETAGPYTPVLIRHWVQAP